MLAQFAAILGAAELPETTPNDATISNGQTRRLRLDAIGVMAWPDLLHFLLFVRQLHGQGGLSYYFFSNPMNTNFWARLPSWTSVV